MNAKEFGEFLKSTRKNKKMTIRQLELYSGVSNAYISQLERGIKGIPSPDILQKLAKPLGLEYEELMSSAGYIEGNETTRLLDKFLYHIADTYNLEELIIKEYGKVDEDFKSLRELLDTMNLEEKLEVFMAATDNLENVALDVNDRGEKEFYLGYKKRDYNLEEDNFVDEINLTYKGMKLNRSEKLEFLSIARAIFDARRGLQEKDWYDPGVLVEGPECLKTYL